MLIPDKLLQEADLPEAWCHGRENGGFISAGSLLSLDSISDPLLC